MERRDIEKRWQKKWEEAKVFEATPDDREKFFMAIPYPYASGPLHIGHGRTYTNADVIVRYWRMKGKNAFWPMAFHITGTPILAISSQLRRGDEKTRRLYASYVGLYEKDPKKVEEILQKLKEPENVAAHFSKVMREDFKSLGFSIDWTRQFTTGDKDYNSFIDWQFRQLDKLGYLVKGSYPVLYCTRCQNAVGEDDIKSGDTIKASVADYSAIKFKLNDAYLVAATFRPETIFGITNLWVNPGSTYVRAKVGDDTWIVSKEAYEKLRRQKEDVNIEGELIGEELVGKEVETPIGRKVPILPGSFVGTTEATGVVYSVPAHAPYDYAALADLQARGQHLKIEPISMIEIQGYGEFPAVELCKKLKVKDQNDPRLEEATKTIYKAEFYKGKLKSICGDFAGEPVSNVKEKVFSWLFRNGWADHFYEVDALEKPVKCRCGGDIVVSLLKDQWFLNYGDPKWKELAKECLEKMVIYPKIYRKFFEDTFNWLDKRPCARKRGLGTKLPFDESWIIESLSDSTIYMCFYTVVQKIRENNISPEKLTYEFWDYVLGGRGDPSEVSKTTGIEEKLIKKMHGEFEYWYPVDLRHTAIAHISNHLSFFIFNHAGLFPKDKWPRAITLNEMLIREGKKMSKSLGNVIPLVDIPRKYSADLFRLYSVYGADFSSVLDWRDKDVESVKKKLDRLTDMFLEYKDLQAKKPETALDSWLASVFASSTLKASDAIESYRLRDYVQVAFFDLINTANYYLHRGGKREVLRSFIPEWVRLLAPVIPHTSEEIWQHYGDGFVSLADWPVAKKSSIDPALEAGEELVRQTLEDINEITKLVGKPEKIYIYTSPPWKEDVVRMVRENMDKSDSEMVSEAMKTNLKAHGKQTISLIQKYVRDKSKLPRIMLRAGESKTLNEAKGFLERETGAQVIIDSGHDPKNKGAVAIPMKPAIYFE